MMAQRYGVGGPWCGRYVALFAMACLPSGAAQADSTSEDELPADIGKAITQREARTRTIRLEWVENLIVNEELAESPPVEGLRTIETLRGKSTWSARRLAVVVLAVGLLAAIIYWKRHKR